MNAKDSRPTYHHAKKGLLVGIVILVSDNADGQVRISFELDGRLANDLCAKEYGR